MRATRSGIIPGPRPHRLPPARTLTLLAIAALAGCASYPEQVAELEEARSTVARVDQMPGVGEVAADHLRDAKSELERAEQLFEDRGDVAEVQHRAYLARRHAEVAEEQLTAAEIQEQISQSEVQRTKLQLQARTAEAETAQAAAARARQEAEALSSELEGLKAEPTERGVVLTLGDVLFDTASATLKPGGQDAIGRVAGYLQNHPDRRVLIEGHTDSRGSEAYNEELSARRANSVRDALMRRGIDADRVTAIGAGESYPVASNNTTAGQQLNRRVEIIISDEQGGFPGGASRGDERLNLSVR